MNRGFEKLLAILLIAALALAGGTAMLRPASEKPARVPPPTEAPTVTAAPAPPVTEAPPAPAETAEPTPEPTEAPPEYYTLNFVGDCTLASSPYYMGGPNGYDTIMKGDYAYPFAKTVQFFRDDDFTFANVEVCLTNSNNATAKTFVFKAPPEYAKILTEGSVEFAGLANNHVLDYGQQGYADTKAAIAAEGIAYAGRDEWAVYKTPRGMKIGVYAVSFGTLDQIRTGVKAVRDAGADFVIAALHWGDEGSYQVNAQQREQGHAAVEAGADFVYGSHPHTLQPFEEYQGRWIYYSMGNWTFGGNTNPRDKDTLILNMTVAQYADGHTEVTDTKIIPCACSGEKSFNNYQPVPYEEGTEDYDRVLSKLNGTFTGANLTVGYGYTANE